MAQHFAPEEVSGAVLATELASDLVSRGHRVCFVTCVPSYPQGVVFAGYRNSLYSSEIIQDVRVIRTWSYISPEKTFWHRILNYGTFSLGAFFGGLAAGRQDVILSYSPPLTLGMAAWLLGLVWGVPWVLRVEDLFPKAAVDTGVITNRFAIRVLYALERFLYRRAQHVSLISESFRRHVLDQGFDPNKLSVFPVWADPNAIRPSARENDFRDKHQLDGKFVVMYSGNFGLTSALEDVVKAAQLLRDENRIVFVLVGEGLKKTDLMELVKKEQLANVFFLPYQPRHEYSEMLAAADVSLVTINRTHSQTSLPSKIFNLMASQRPVLAIAPQDSDIARLVMDAHCGRVMEPDQPELVAQSLVEIMNDADERERMGKNARAALLAQFSRRCGVDRYEEVLQNVVDQFRKRSG